MKKKGFTLIELLAVIVILAIIALIATPLVLKYIEYSKERSAKLSANTYAEAVEKEYVSKLTHNEKMDNKSYSISELDELGVKIKGDKPVGENDYVVLNNGNVIEYVLTIKGYIIAYKDGNTTIESEKDSNSNSKKINALDYTVTFTVDSEPYHITSVTAGQAINIPATNPIKDGEKFSCWQIGGKTVSFPYTPNEDVEMNALFLTGTDRLYSHFGVDKNEYPDLFIYSIGGKVKFYFCDELYFYNDDTSDLRTKKNYVSFWPATYVYTDSTMTDINDVLSAIEDSEEDLYYGSFTGVLVNQEADGYYWTNKQSLLNTSGKIGIWAGI